MPYSLYKSFIRPHLDYGDITYDKPENEDFQNELINYKKFNMEHSFAITGAIQGASRQNLYDKLGLHSLSKRRRRNKPFFYKTLNGFLPKYLYSYLTFPSQENSQ